MVDIKTLSSSCSIFNHESKEKISATLVVSLERWMMYILGCYNVSYSYFVLVARACFSSQWLIQFLFFCNEVHLITSICYVWASFLVAFSLVLTMMHVYTCEIIYNNVILQLYCSFRQSLYKTNKMYVLSPCANWYLDKIFDTYKTVTPLTITSHWSRNFPWLFFPTPFSLSLSLSLPLSLSPLSLSLSLSLTLSLSLSPSLIIYL